MNSRSCWTLSQLGVGGPGSAGHDVEQPGVQASLLVAGQVHHRRHRSVAALMTGPPDVLVDTERAHPASPAQARRAPARLEPRPPSTGCASPTRRCRASAETVVSSWASASTAQPIAREVSTARGAISSWSSDQVAAAQSGSAQRQIRLSHTTSTGTPKHGASAALHPPPVPDRDHTADGAARRVGVGLDRDHQLAVRLARTSSTCMPSLLNIASARAHQRTPEPHLSWSTSGSSIFGQLGRSRS